MESDFLIFRGTLFQSLVADTVKEGPPSVSSFLVRTDRIIASIPYASVMLCIVNRKLFIQIVWKRAIYALI